MGPTFQALSSIFSVLGVILASKKWQICHFNAIISHNMEKNWKAPEKWLHMVREYDGVLDAENFEPKIFLGSE